MIQLGALLFDGTSANLTWPDRDNYSPVAQQRARTVTGTQVVWSQEETLGRPITLVATNDQGWLTKAQKDAVIAMAQQAGATFALTIGVESFTVMFRHEEGDAVSFSPLISRAVDLSEDYFTGQIKLFTV